MERLKYVSPEYQALLNKLAEKLLRRRLAVGQTALFDERQYTSELLAEYPDKPELSE